MMAPDGDILVFGEEHRLSVMGRLFDAVDVVMEEIDFLLAQVREIRIFVSGFDPVGKVALGDGGVSGGEREKIGSEWTIWMEAYAHQPVAVVGEGFFAGPYKTTLSSPSGMQVVLVENVRPGPQHGSCCNNQREGDNNSAGRRNAAL